MVFYLQNVGGKPPFCVSDDYKRQDAGGSREKSGEVVGRA